MILLIDGNNLLHRSIHMTQKWSAAAGSLSAYAGTFTLLRSVRATLAEFPHIARVVVVWDGALSARRRLLLPTYKDRDRDPTRQSELFGELETARRALDLLGIVSYRDRFYEADDVIAHFAHCAMDRVLIMSDDKDLLQCVSDVVHVWRPIAEKRQAGLGYITPDIFRIKIAPFPPDRWVYYRALTGDSGDKIPGIFGIGEKTALKIVQAMDRASFGSFLMAWQSVTKTPTAGEVDLADRNVQLMRLADEDMDDLEIPWIDVPIGQAPDVARLTQAFGLWNFKSLLTDLPKWLDPFTRLARPRRIKTPVNR